MVIYLPAQAAEDAPVLDELTPREIVRELDKYVIGQNDAKRAVAFALFARFETKLEQHNGNLPRAVVELAKDWRTDRILRHLEALLLVADTADTYLVSGNGDVIEPDDQICSIGSGGPYAKAAATALYENTKLSARQIVEKAMAIAGHICIYTNNTVVYEELG